CLWRLRVPRALTRKNYPVRGLGCWRRARRDRVHDVGVLSFGRGEPSRISSERAAAPRPSCALERHRLAVYTRPVGREERRRRASGQRELTPEIKSQSPAMPPAAGRTDTLTVGASV